MLFNHAMCICPGGQNAGNSKMKFSQRSESLPPGEHEFEGRAGGDEDWTPMERQTSWTVINTIIMSMGNEALRHSVHLFHMEEIFLEAFSGSATQRNENVTPIHKKGRKDGPGNYRPVSLTSVPGKVMEQIILSVIMQRMKEA
ncbi:rna-directed dna polymerase from mobile element hypothetical protein [Limosa lapponica baueri]|uniref:Rna-directed dna polymerase from mobile element jockey-like n=1 Tax=Limosa lapponica baueri TaxID=1758121 RepID=A0A2I0UJH7_LIMLA|nr:rna-directed dna polymerase from mobile element hypothetical protein [Limosa lapponica baueri]